MFFTVLCLSFLSLPSLASRMPYNCGYSDYRNTIALLCTPSMQEKDVVCTQNGVYEKYFALEKLDLETFCTEPREAEERIINEICCTTASCIIDCYRSSEVGQIMKDFPKNIKAILESSPDLFHPDLSKRVSSFVDRWAQWKKDAEDQFREFYLETAAYREFRQIVIDNVRKLYARIYENGEPNMKFLSDEHGSNIEYAVAAMDGYHRIHPNA